MNEKYIYLLDGGILSSIQQNKMKTKYQKIMNPEIYPVLRKLQNGRYYDKQTTSISSSLQWGLFRKYNCVPSHFTRKLLVSGFPKFGLPFFHY